MVAVDIDDGALGDMDPSKSASDLCPNEMDFTPLLPLQ